MQQKFVVVYSGKSNDTELGQTEPNELDIDENNYNHEETEDKRKTTINKNHITLLNGLGKMENVQKNSRCSFTYSQIS